MQFKFHISQFFNNFYVFLLHSVVNLEVINDQNIEFLWTHRTSGVVAHANIELHHEYSRRIHRIWIVRGRCLRDRYDKYTRLRSVLCIFSSRLLDLPWLNDQALSRSGQKWFVDID